MPSVEYKTAFCFIIYPIINNLKQITTSFKRKYRQLSALETMANSVQFPTQNPVSIHFTSPNHKNIKRSQ